MIARQRDGLVLLIVGIVGAFITLSVATWLRRGACLDAGGRWIAAQRTCELAGGGAPPPSSAVRVYAIGAIMGLLVATVLWRTFTFIAHRAATHRPR